jgi:hypothetical protein
VGSVPVLPDGGGSACARPAVPPGALAECAPNLASAFRRIQVRTLRRSNRNAVLTRVAGISPLRTARRMVSVLTPMTTATSLIDRFFVFISMPWFNVLSHPKPEILCWELGRCMLMYPMVRSCRYL